MPYAVMHLPGRRGSFFHGAEGTTQTPIAVVYHAVEIELVLDEVNVPDPPSLSVEDNQNSLRSAEGSVLLFISTPNMLPDGADHSALRLTAQGLSLRGHLCIGKV